MAFADAQDNAVIYYAESGADIVLAGTVAKGDALGYSDGWKRALATTGSVVQMRCVAEKDGVSGQTIKGYFGVCLVGGDRFSGATANGALYVAEGSDNGKYTQTIPTTSGDATTRVGTAISATLMLITPNQNVDSTA
jgi:hypothetical protein